MFQAQDLLAADASFIGVNSLGLEVIGLTVWDNVAAAAAAGDEQKDSKTSKNEKKEEDYRNVMTRAEYEKELEKRKAEDFELMQLWKKEAEDDCLFIKVSPNDAPQQEAQMHNGGSQREGEKDNGDSRHQELSVRIKFINGERSTSWCPLIRGRNNLGVRAGGRMLARGLMGKDPGMSMVAAGMMGRGLINSNGHVDKGKKPILA
ncbi:unnamed protein product [Dovyalis caffra]|uniref:Uncharacterized protein n=1 Tax=Dovyalis caffra TaxID=77055 RepID=A0AAV1S3J1_9ROSI|nr:unnamed protein product [Dovyalis caffra]